MLDIVNLEAGQTVAGGRGYYLINEGVLLNQALINYGLQFAYKRNYMPGEHTLALECCSVFILSQTKTPWSQGRSP